MFRKILLLSISIPKISNVSFTGKEKPYSVSPRTRLVLALINYHPIFMVPLTGHANIVRSACFQGCRIDVGVVHLMIIRISVQLGLLDVEEKIVYENVE